MVVKKSITLFAVTVNCVFICCTYVHILLQKV